MEQTKTLAALLEIPEEKVVLQIAIMKAALLEIRRQEVSLATAAEQLHTAINCGYKQYWVWVCRWYLWTD